MELDEELYVFTEQELERLIETNQIDFSNEDILNFLEALEPTAYHTPILDQLQPNLTESHPHQEFNLFDLNLISGEIINLNINSSPEIINPRENIQKDEYSASIELGLFGGGDEDEYKIIRETSRKNLKFNCTETVIN